MNLYKQIWDELSVIDVSAHIEKKGNLSYLSWAWAYGTLMKYYPHNSYSFSHETFPDGTMMVECMLTIQDGDEMAMRSMWLPVLDFKNKPIANPNAFQINSTRMRCLVKCISMFGLGHYIYAGEDLPTGKEVEVAQPKKRINKEMKQQYVTAFLEALENEDAIGLKELGDELREDEDMMSAVWSEFSSKQKAEIKAILDQLRKNTL